MSTEPREPEPARLSAAERREQRFRIAGDPAEAMKVVLAQLPGEE